MLHITVVRYMDAFMLQKRTYALQQIRTMLHSAVLRLVYFPYWRRMCIIFPRHAFHFMDHTIDHSLARTSHRMQVMHSLTMVSCEIRSSINTSIIRAEPAPEPTMNSKMRPRPRCLN
jgi:hypothetical protein